MKTAFLVDGGFFIRRYRFIKGFESFDSPEEVAKNLVSYCFRHINRINNYRSRYNLLPTELYRIFFYDAKPFNGDSKKPISGRSFSFKNTPQYKFRNELFKALENFRKTNQGPAFWENKNF